MPNIPIIHTFKKYWNLILVLGFAYAAIITFPAFGPVLHRVVPVETALLMSIWTMLFLTIGFALPHKLVHKIEFHKYYITGLGGITALLTGLFPLLPQILKGLALALLGFIAGRIVVLCADIFLLRVPKKLKGQVLSGMFVLSYGTLYICNVIVPSLPIMMASSIPAMLLAASIIIYTRFKPSQPANLTEKPPGSDFPWGLFLLILGIYITAGVTYAGVYPFLNKHYTLERYYNVLPFVISVVFAGYIADTKGRKYSLYLGLAFLGLSFTFFSFPAGNLTYFLIQSTMQPAWAFLDLFVWVLAADIASQNNQPAHYHIGLSFVMAGVMIGSLLSFAVRNSGLFDPVTFTFLAHIPLFIALAFIWRIPETLHNEEKNPPSLLLSQAIDPETVTGILTEEFQLTARETELALLILAGHTYSNIADSLIISVNTVKFHSRNIFNKLSVTSKQELRKKISDLLRNKQ